MKTSFFTTGVLVASVLAAAPLSAQHAQNPLVIDSMAGPDLFQFYCAPCHGLTGRGTGMVVQRGYRPPPSFHIERLRNERPGYYFDVISRGFGAMPDYAAQIPVRDRWAIVAYVRALQLSQSVPIAELPSDVRKKVPGGPTP